MKIQDVAVRAGVSAATVSRVFSHHPNIREEVRARVFAVARECGFHPRLSTKQRNIVVITPGKSAYPAYSYIEMVLNELASELAGREYRIEILPAGNLGRLPRIQFCGAVAIELDEHLFPDWSERFSVPLITVNCPVSPRSENICGVHSDEAQGMKLAIGYLHRNGYRKIGCVVHGKSGIGAVDARISGIFAALRQYGLPETPNLVRTALAEEYVEEIGKLLRCGIDALFCPGGNAGILSAYALSLYNKRVPEDIALLSSERSVFSRYATPPQTVISQDYPAQAHAVLSLLDAFYDRTPMEKNTVIPYHLIERESVMLR